MYVIRLLAVAAYFQHSSRNGREPASDILTNRSESPPSIPLFFPLPSLPSIPGIPKSISSLPRELISAASLHHSSSKILDHEETMFISQVCIKIFIIVHRPFCGSVNPPCSSQLYAITKFYLISFNKYSCYYFLVLRWSK